jgi:DNA-nicking Smr family endonuclease
MRDDPPPDDQAFEIPIETAIDLHAFAPRDVLSVVEDYLEAAYRRGFAEVRLIHGRGRGVQRAAVQRLLRTHSLVADFWDAPETHLGATVVRLKAPPDPNRSTREPSH